MLSYRSIIYVIYPTKYSNIVDRYSQIYSVPREIIYSIILIESGFDEGAVSHAGACGLMQLMPETFSVLMGTNESGTDLSMIFDPEINIRFGVLLLSRLYEKYNNWTNVFAAYNAGERAVDKWLVDPAVARDGTLINIPYSETSRYVIKVHRAVSIYKIILN